MTDEEDIERTVYDQEKEEAIAADDPGAPPGFLLDPDDEHVGHPHIEEPVEEPEP